MKSWVIRKDPDAGRDWGQEEKGTTEDEMARWHHWLDGHEFGWTPGVGDRQGAWRAVIHGVAKSWTQLSDWTELNLVHYNKPKLTLKKSIFRSLLYTKREIICEILQIPIHAPTYCLKITYPYVHLSNASNFSEANFTGRIPLPKDSLPELRFK